MIVFREEASAPKTRRWTLLNNGNGSVLGWVSWYAPWRKYAFVPHSPTVFDEGCLREIAGFCEQHTTRHKALKFHEPVAGTNEDEA